MSNPHRPSRFPVASLAVALSLAAVLSAAGCGDDDGPTQPGPNAPADSFPPATSPESAVLRLFETYSALNLSAYDRTLTRDFRYRFSVWSDPELVTEFGGDWDVAMEDLSARHLSEGFTDDLGNYQQAASSIEFLVASTTVLSDTTHADSTRHYARVAIPLALLSVDLADGTQFQVSSPFVVYVVRGDAAVLDAGQAPDTTVWYVRRIDDLAPPLAGARRMKPARVSTWGMVRVMYFGHGVGVVE